jgi:trehalose 6-phosphate phosphatase
MPSDGPSPCALATLPPPPEGSIAGISLFLDFDGTLVDIAARPDEVLVDPSLPPLLAALARRLDGRLAIVSGRTASDIAAHLGPIEGCAMVGSHGLELLWPDGRLDCPPPPASLDEMIAEVRELAVLMPGVMIEPKPFGVALHYREAPSAADAVAALATNIARRGEFALQRGKMVFELRARGADKGDAVTALLALPAMAGSRPIFVGDDLTDEAGFRAAAAAGGAGILVGCDPQRETVARYGLPDVAAVHAWLATLVEREAA